MLGMLFFYLKRRCWKVYRKSIENVLTIGDYKTVHVTQGGLRGRAAFDIKGHKFYSFKGIPYAEPPIGKLRFKAPVSKLPWDGVRDAFEFGNVSRARNAFKPTEFVGSEDCLYLNVYAPDVKDPEELKPVMLFIHGGSFLVGSGNDDVYGPEYLVAENVILVTFNYRLGALGFCAFSDPEIECPGNTALKDTLEVLKWIKLNISQFNGDPNNVTIFGESAGAAMTHYMSLIPQAKGYFHKSICQSGQANANWACYKSRPFQLAKELGFESENEKEVYEFLVGVPAEKIVEVQENLVTEWDLRNGVTAIWVPTIEVKTKEQPNVITQHPISLLEDGDFNDIPMIMGYNKEEGLLFLADLLPNKLFLVPDFTDNEVLTPKYLQLPRHSQISKDTGDVLRRFYYGESIPSYENVEPFINVMTDIAFFTTCQWAVKRHIKYSKQPVFMYRFCVDSPQSLTKEMLQIKYSGAAHADDLAYLFTNMLSAPTLEEGSLGTTTVRRMVKLWTNFARTGNPTPEADPLLNVNWDPIRSEDMKLLNIEDRLEMCENPDIDRAKMWESLEEKFSSYIREYIDKCHKVVRCGNKD